VRPRRLSSTAGHHSGQGWCGAGDPEGTLGSDPCTGTAVARPAALMVATERVIYASDCDGSGTIANTSQTAAPTTMLPGANARSGTPSSDGTSLDVWPSPEPRKTSGLTSSRLTTDPSEIPAARQ